MQSRTIIVSLLAAALALTFGTASAADGNAAAGKIKFESGTPASGQPACTTCHGNDGDGSSPMFPALAGQYEDYLVQALKEYKSGERSNAIMAPNAKALSDQDIQNVAAYLSSLPGKLSDLHGKIQGGN